MKLFSFVAIATGTVAIAGVRIDYDPDQIIEVPVYQAPPIVQHHHHCTVVRRTVVVPAQLPKDWEREEPNHWSGTAVQDWLVGRDTGMDAGSPATREELAVVAERVYKRSVDEASRRAAGLVQNEAKPRGTFAIAAIGGVFLILLIAAILKNRP